MNKRKSIISQMAWEFSLLKVKYCVFNARFIPAQSTFLIFLIWFRLFRVGVILIPWHSPEKPREKHLLPEIHRIFPDFALLPLKAETGAFYWRQPVSSLLIL
jgi:hypothetical protein